MKLITKYVITIVRTKDEVSSARALVTRHYEYVVGYEKILEPNEQMFVNEIIVPESD